MVGKMTLFPTWGRPAPKQNGAHMIQSYKGIIPRIDPTAWVHPMATVIGDVELGPGVSIWPGAVLRGDCGLIRIGADSNIQDGTICHTTGGLSELIVGDRVTVGHRVVLHGCIIGDDCLIGMGSTVLDNAEIPAWSLVGAASLVPGGKRYEAGLIAGSPAMWKRPLGDKLAAMIEDGYRSYHRYMAAFVAGEVETIG